MTTEVALHAAAMMGTLVSIQVRGRGTETREARMQAAERAMAWFASVERALSRFDAQSELRRVTAMPNVPLKVSPMTFAAVQFALAIAEETNGAFDPTVGGRMLALGFDRNFRSGEHAEHLAPDDVERASWRDVVLDASAHTIEVRRALVLDLGAVAKGLAVDLAARELGSFVDFAIDAGGDQYLGGTSAEGRPWRVGIRHARSLDKMDVVEVLEVSDLSVCTSGDYERRVRSLGRPLKSVNAEGAENADGRGTEGGEQQQQLHHILDPRTGKPSAAAASVTVVAPSAMVADALATAVFVLGPREGLALLARHGAEGMVLTPAMERFVTAGWMGTPVSAARGEAR